MLNNLLYVTGILMTGFTLNYHIFDSKSYMNFISNLQEEEKRKDIPDLCLRCTFISYTNISEICRDGLTTNVISKFNHQPLSFLMVYNEWEIDLMS